MVLQPKQNGVSLIILAKSAHEGIHHEFTSNGTEEVGRSVIFSKDMLGDVLLGCHGKGKDVMEKIAVGRIE